MTAVVRVATADDVESAAEGADTAAGAAHYRERFGWQQAGHALLLLAWERDRVAGRATLTLYSKYPAVRAEHPALAEVNALGANPTGRGTGTLLLEAAIDLSRDRGIPAIGLAVEATNPAARLYRRLGFEDWGAGDVVDVWSETDDDGGAIEHADRCSYLVRMLG